MEVARVLRKGGNLDQIKVAEVLESVIGGVQ